jgi:hypothetical protein
MGFLFKTVVLGALLGAAQGEDGKATTQRLASVASVCAALSSSGHTACDAVHVCEWRGDACGAQADSHGAVDVPHVLVGAAAGAANAGLHALLQGSGAIDCTSAKTEADCAATQADCRWCVCHAVPSVCVTPDVAARLPPSVFSCGMPAPGQAAGELPTPTLGGKGELDQTAKAVV